MNTNGKATIGYRTPQQQELEIIDFVQADFADHRLVSVMELEDGTYIMSVENPESSGRATHQSIRLGKESFTALLFTAHLFCEGKGVGLVKMLEEIAPKGEINYTFSKGITPPV